MRQRKGRVTVFALLLSGVTALALSGVLAPTNWRIDIDIAQGRDAIGDGVARLAAMQTGRELAFASVGEGPPASPWVARYGAYSPGVFGGAPSPLQETPFNRWLWGDGEPAAEVGDDGFLPGDAYLDTSDGRLHVFDGESWTPVLILGGGGGRRAGRRRAAR